MQNPKISVIMSVYNGEEFLADAVDSILMQTYNNFEFIIVDDGSTDSTPKILAANKDPRIKIITQKNQGLVTSLNKAALSAKGDYLARQDADDISAPSRLEQQLRILEADGSLVMIGSSVSIMDMKSNITHEHHVLLDNPELKQELLLRSPFAHGSVMMVHADFIKSGGYKKEEWPAEDYGLWLRMATLGDFSNIDDPLYVYRENTKGISASNIELQNKKVHQLQNKAWTISKYLLAPGRINLNQYKNITDGEERIGRIIGTSNWVTKKSIRKGTLSTGLKSFRSIGHSVAPYKKIAGKIKRKIRRS